MDKVITSIQNPKLKEAVKLFQRKQREESHLFLIEGYRELLRAIQGGVFLQSLYICPEFFLGVNEQTLIEEARVRGTEVISCSPRVFAKLSYRDRPDGLIAIGVQMQMSLAELIARLARKEHPLLVIAESIEKPGNLGTILRSADAAGADGVIVCDRCTDIYNPNVVRASVGTLFSLPVVEAESPKTLLWLRERSVKIIAATPSAKETFTQTNLLGGVAIVVGTEQLGLSKQWIHAADVRVRIPMHGQADSLNVAMATTLLLYECLRQRNETIPWRYS
jgi:RNA methyltransferase, TrmH family